MYLSVLLYFLLCCVGVLYIYKEKTLQTETRLSNLWSLIVMNTSVKKALFIIGVSTLALADIGTAVAYLGVEQSLFIGDAIAADIA